MTSLLEVMEEHRARARTQHINLYLPLLHILDEFLFLNYVIMIHSGDELQPCNIWQRAYVLRNAVSCFLSLSVHEGVIAQTETRVVGSLLEQNCHAGVYSCTLPVRKLFVGSVINHPTLYCQNMYHCLINATLAMAGTGLSACNHFFLTPIDIVKSLQLARMNKSI